MPDLTAIRKMERDVLEDRYFGLLTVMELIAHDYEVVMTLSDARRLARIAANTTIVE